MEVRTLEKCVSIDNLKVTLRCDIPHCVSQNHKVKQQTLESQNTTILYYIIYIYIIYIADDGNRSYIVYCTAPNPFY